MAGYQLLDAGEERKLELLGPYRVDRQAAQAYWPKSLDRKTWGKIDALHHRAKSGGGHWEWRKELPSQWTVPLEGFQFQVRLTDFGHIGLFPEQAENWSWLKGVAGRKPMRLLNLFGYTGGSSLAAARGGAEVTHVDASKGVVNWAKVNAEANGIDRIRWIVEDVSRFVEREQRRGNSYQGIVLDPPSFGRGPRGQVWKIETTLIPFLMQIKKILQPLQCVLLSCHTPGYSGLCLSNILHLVFDLPVAQIECGEMTIPYGDREVGLALPSGHFARWSA